MHEIQQSILRGYLPILLKYIDTKLTGRALELTEYCGISTRKKAKAILKDTLESKQSLANLQL